MDPAKSITSADVSATDTLTPVSPLESLINLCGLISTLNHNEWLVDVVYRSLLSFGTQTMHGLYRSAVHCFTVRCFTAFADPVGN